jgi:hypothetical protein
MAFFPHLSTARESADVTLTFTAASSPREYAIAHRSRESDSGRLIPATEGRFKTSH